MDVTKSSDGVVRKAGKFVKGSKRPPNAGRRKGTPNVATKAVRDFLAELCDDTVVQRSVRRRIIKRDTQGFFKALDKLVPDPPRQLQVSGKMEWVLSLPNGDDVAEAD